MELTFGPVGCGTVIEEVAASLRPLAEAKGLSFDIATPDGNVVVRSAHRPLSQILINLTANAIKFTDHGGVWLTVRRRPDLGVDAVALSVTDTGRGILPADQARLFEAFTQVETESAPQREGSGLGLHLSQRLAGLLGGHITVESSPGTGSTFTLVLGGD